MLTRDQVALCCGTTTWYPSAARDVADARSKASASQPESFESVVPTYLYRFRKTGQFAPHRFS